MKAISLTQPWATLVALRAKKIETRSWATKYRGPIAIHASATYPPECRRLAASEPFSTALGSAWTLPLGAVLATAELIDVQQIHSTDDVRYLLKEHGAAYEYSFGNFASGRYAWILKDIDPFRYPVAARGALGLWEWESRLPEVQSS